MISQIRTPETCGIRNDTAANTDDNTGDASSDLAYITGKKKLVIGITEYQADELSGRR